METSSWLVYITNDNCPDYTWGYTEEQTRQAFADIVAAHLDEMNRTDREVPENRDHYNMAVTQEALCFLQHYPHREPELVRRVREGRLFVSPYLCNSLWGFQSFESAIRAFYPARRLERRWGTRLDVAEHIEEPSLPWGLASILAGCGIRWLSVPFYAYDSTFADLENPPLFILQGPDGGRVRVIMDPWACNKASYSQGARLLGEPEAIANEWIPHYTELGPTYPLRAVLASGTHGDISPTSGEQAAGFTDAIKRYNGFPQPHPKLVNATLSRFCERVDQAEREAPFLPILRGCFGHSWDLWPVSLAAHAADLRENERAFLAAEALLAVVARIRPELSAATRQDRERAEWCWAMLSDHAWNGTDEANKRQNAALRRRWNEELRAIAARLSQQAWAAAGPATEADRITLLNSLSLPRRELVALPAAGEELGVADGDCDLPTQLVEDEGKRLLCFVSPLIDGFASRQIHLGPWRGARERNGKLRASQAGLESPYYLLKVDQETGGMGSLMLKVAGAELVAAGAHRTLCQTVYFRGREHLLTHIDTDVVAAGPVLARLRITGAAADLRVTNLVTVYAELDRVDFDLRVTKPVTTEEERLCQVFPVMPKGARLRIETPGAVIVPLPQPEGDLLPGADRNRFAVQGFVDVCSPDGTGVTIAPLDGFALRLDLDPITFEALGNDQNHPEVVQDQDGVARFRFRYALRGYTSGYDQARALCWSRSVATPLICSPGGAGKDHLGPPIVIDPGRAIATCLKPADGEDAEGTIARLWETSGRSGPLNVAVPGCRRVVRTDLLERDLEELAINEGAVSLTLPAYGFTALRLLP